MLSGLFSPHSRGPETHSSVLFGDLAMTVDIPVIRTPRYWLSASLYLPRCKGVYIIPGRVLASLFLDFLDFAYSDKALRHDSQVLLRSLCSPKHLPSISVYCLLCPISTVSGVYILPSRDPWLHESRNSFSFSSDYPQHLIPHLELGMCPTKNT